VERYVCLVVGSRFKEPIMSTEEPKPTGAWTIATLGLMADAAKALDLECAERDIRWAIDSLRAVPVRAEHIAAYLRGRARNEFRRLPFWAQPAWFGRATEYCLQSGRAYASAAFVIRLFAQGFLRW
jgi:hypothetical protein